MLETRHLKKTYRAKGGAVTKALDDVSILFPARGLVFILGKSGCGKSTLLHICGGLDRPDEGEIVIKGRSSADFSPADFDSYRNTCVGFVFQDYNVLNDFSVEENIALSLELQNKKKDPQKIRQILRSVDLEGVADRRPNTLSGGQKQRVAIARALVKEPEIILADEPTGALDSETGRQVLETLKKLSADKLVIAVSHDREFAEQYADRIIELKDGKVISDVSRTGESGQTPNLRFLEDTVTVRDCSALTEEDFGAIRRFLSSSKSGAMLTCSRDEVAKAQAAMPGAAGKFEQTAPSVPREHAPAQPFIRSHLPFRHAFRMGASCVRTHPVRLVFSIFLCLVAFVMFGLFSTMMFYDGQRAARDALAASDVQYLSYRKGYRETIRSYTDGELTYTATRTKDTDMTAEEYAALKGKFPGTLAAFGPDSFGVQGWLAEDTRFYTDRFQGYVYAEENAHLPALLWGNYPQNTGEAAISDFTFDCMRNSQMNLSDTQISLESYADLSRLPALSLPGGDMKIVGVYRADSVPAKFRKLQEAAAQHLPFDGSSDLLFAWQNLRSAGFYTYLLTHDSFAEKYRASAAQEADDPDPTERFLPFTFSLKYGERQSVSLSYINTYSEGGKYPLLGLYSVQDGRSVSSLSEGEIALSMQTYAQILYDTLHSQVQARYDAVQEGDPGAEETEEMYTAFTEGDPLTGTRSIEDLFTLNLMRGYTETDTIGEDGFPVLRPLTEEEVRAGVGEVFAFMQKYSFAEPALRIANSFTGSETDARCAAFFFDARNPFAQCAYATQAIFDAASAGQKLLETKSETKYTIPENAFIRGVFVPDFRTNGALETLTARTFTVQEDDSTAAIGNPEMEDARQTSETVYWLRWFFLGMGLGLMAFAILLMFNFISASIAGKKKEIGILRALGARAADIYKVFFSEALIVATACFVLAVAACALLAPACNNLIAESTMLTTRLLRFGPLSVILMAAAALFTAALSTFVPVALYSRKPPVDSIRAL